MRIFFVMAIMAAAAWSQTVGGLAIVVKERPITLYDIKTAMRQENLPRDKAVDLLIRETLEEMEIEQRGLRVTPEELQGRIEQMAAQNRLSVPQLYDAVKGTQGLGREAFRARLKKNMLTQKLYGAIAFSGVEEPDEAEMREYYRLHSEKFSRPEQFELTVYSASSQEALQQKIANPMLNLPAVTSHNVTLPYAKLDTRLAELLTRTERGTFTPVLPDPKGGVVAFYVRNKSLPMMVPFEDVRSQVKEEMMADVREQTLKDYFERARMNAEIRTVRLPE